MVAETLPDVELVVLRTGGSKHPTIVVVEPVGSLKKAPAHEGRVYSKLETEPVNPLGSDGVPDIITPVIVQSSEPEHMPTLLEIQEFPVSTCVKSVPVTAIKSSTLISPVCPLAVTP